MERGETSKIDRTADVSAWAALLAWPVLGVSALLWRLTPALGVAPYLLGIACIVVGMLGSLLAVCVGRGATRRVGGIGLVAAALDIAVAAFLIYAVASIGG